MCLVVCLQLLPWRLRQLPQLAARAAEGHGDARVEHVAQLDEDDELLVAAQRRQRAPPAPVRARAPLGAETRCTLSARRGRDASYVVLTYCFVRRVLGLEAHKKSAHPLNYLGTTARVQSVALFHYTSI